MTEAALVIMIIAVAVLLCLVYNFWQDRIGYRARLKRYSGLIDVEAAKESATRQLEEFKQQSQKSLAEETQRKEKLETQYKDALAKYQALQHEVSLLEE